MSFASRTPELPTQDAGTAAAAAAAAAAAVVRSDSRRSLWPYVVLLGGALVGYGVGVYIGRRLARRAALGRVKEGEATSGDVAVDNGLDGSRGWQASERAYHEDAKPSGEIPFQWAQTYDEVLMEFRVRPNIKSQNVKCKFNTYSIRVEVEGRLLLQGDLFKAVQPDACSWELDGSGNKRVLRVMLVKATLHLGYWESVLKPAPANGKG